MCLLICGLLFNHTANSQQNNSEKPAWLDSLHTNVSDSFTESARWFDSFFIDQRYQPPSKASGEARIMLGWEPRSGSLNDTISSFRIRVTLPNARHRTDLIFSDQDELQQQDSPLKDHQGADTNRKSRFNLSLRWTAKHDQRSDWSQRIGIGRRLQPFVRSEYQFSFELSENSNLNWDSSAYYYSRDGFGSHLMLQYELSVDKSTLLRLESQWYFRDNQKDWLWQYNWYNYHQFDDKNAMVYGIYIEGQTKPANHVDEYLLTTRWRKNALRSWLFFEAGPFITWRKNEQYRPSIGIALHVEGYFGQD